MATGWGLGGWGESGWGSVNNVTIAFEGWNASGVAWGDQGWGEGHTNVTGTGAVGTVFVDAVTNIVVNATGVQAIGATGSVSVLTDQVLSVTGVSATPAIGTVVGYRQDSAGCIGNWSGRHYCSRQCHCHWKCAGCRDGSFSNRRYRIC